MSTPPADDGQPAPYDRWSLLDPSTIDYGCFAGSNNGSEPSSADATTSNKKGFYITTAINYTNGPAHMGHAYEAATTDAIARFARLNSKGGSDGNAPTEAYFVTGADEHGEKIAKTAEKEEKEPIDICNKVCLCLCLRRCCCDCFCQVVCTCMAVVLYLLYWTIWTFT